MPRRPAPRAAGRLRSSCHCFCSFRLLPPGRVHTRPCSNAPGRCRPEGAPLPSPRGPGPAAGHGAERSGGSGRAGAQQPPGPRAGRKRGRKRDHAPARSSRRKHERACAWACRQRHFRNLCFRVAARPSAPGSASSRPAGGRRRRRPGPARRPGGEACKCGGVRGPRPGPAAGFAGGGPGPGRGCLPGPAGTGLPGASRWLAEAAALRALTPASLLPLKARGQPAGELFPSAEGAGAPRGSPGCGSALPGPGREQLRAAGRPGGEV